MLKRVFDILLSLLGIIIFSPILIAISLAIKISDKGPIFYRGERIGRSGKVFKIIKFRSMVLDAEKLGSSVALPTDPRLTKIGKFLKRHKLDELPQLFNILKGEMSFVGPRPEVKKIVDMYTEEEKRIIFSIRPGLTDLATLYSKEEEILRDSPNPEDAYIENVLPVKKKLQIEYVKSHSFILDLNIILETLRRIFLKYLNLN